MIGVSFMGEVGEEMMTERYNISSFFYLLTSIWWPKRTLMDPPESSTFSPSEVLTISVGILTRNVWIRPDQSTMARRRPTLQAAGVEFNEELGLWFGHQSGHAVHDLNPPFGFTVRVWEEARNGVTAEYNRRNGRSAITPCLETNCEATPTSKDAKTGEWSLVVMSVVHPVNLKTLFKYLCY